MNRRSATIVRLFGFTLILLVSAWDVDAMRAHIAAHSWTTLAFVSLFLAAHLSDYLTVGRIVNRFDPLAFAGANEIAIATVAYDERQPSVQTGSTAELYVFNVVTPPQGWMSPPTSPPPRLGPRARLIPSRAKASPCSRSPAMPRPIRPRPRARREARPAQARLPCCRGRKCATMRYPHSEGPS